MSIGKEKPLALLRVSLGFVFLWSFLDKTFGLGYATPPERSWLAGNSPTSGFLTNGTEGPFGEVFAGMAGNLTVDWLFMMGMLGVGTALILGVGMFVATISGSIMMGLIYLSMFPPQQNPIVDEHVVYLFVLWVLYAYRSGEVYGLGKWWRKYPLVKRFKWLA